MTLPSRVAAEFPISAEATYLNHAASGPLPARSAAVLRRYTDDRQHLHRLYQSGRQDYDTTELRKKLGRLLAVPAARVGFVPTTTDGIGMILNGLPWESGDNIVVPSNEFPGVLYGCLRLASRGVEVRQVPVPTGHLDLIDLIARIDHRTRAVAVSHVHWHTGHRIDLSILASACQDRGVLSIVDAIQSVGAVPVDLGATPIDVLLAGTYKWLLGTQGLAVIAVSERALAEVVPDRAGWSSMATSVHAKPELVWAPDARRFSVGGAADPALMVLEASVDLLLEVGVAAIQAHVGMLLRSLASELVVAGLRLNTLIDAPLSPAFVNLTTGDSDLDRRLVQRLAADRIIVACRGPGIRISPHLHNSSDDVARLVGAVR